jgi:mono/diheme cytochrome c family protein
MIRNSFSLSMRHWALLSAGFCLALISLLLLGILVPPVYAQDPLEPDKLPDANSGLPLFADRCANCHGPEGKGDGEIAGQLPKPPRDYTDEEFRRTAVPSSLFQTITDGRPAGAMPPFGPASSNPIETGGRWDLVAAIFSLGTPSEAIENGQILYKENCLACHGEDGAGGGPEAANSITDMPDLTDLRYWFSRSNEMVLANLESMDIADHTYSLETDELWDVIDYTRTFSYVYADPQAALEAASQPIGSVSISGQVMNGTTDGVLNGGTVLLRAFTPELEEAISLETPLDSSGSYEFEVTNASPDWVYMTSVEYGDMSFSSSPDRVQANDPQLEMPITVFDTTEDPSAIQINQVHAIMDFMDDKISVSEIYVLSNLGPAVFVGETGVPEDGTLKLGLPSGAENVDFQRSFSSFENFLPATEVIPTDEGYADTVPVRPGDGIMNLLVSYELPFEEGMTVGHPVFYRTNSATIVMPEVGVEVVGDGWTSQGTQQMGDMGSISSYSRPALQAGEAVSFTLEGRPTATVANVGGSNASENNMFGILLGGTLLLLVAGGAVYTVHSWRSGAEEAIEIQADQVNNLLYELVNLDETYEAGKLEEAVYQERRTQLLQQLAAVWGTTEVKLV